MPAFLSIDTTALTLLGYAMSWLELVGTALYLTSVWLIARRNVWTWPAGLASVILFMLLFWQIRLYADAFEQLYYIAASLYGWWYWLHRNPDTGTRATTGYSKPPVLLLWAAATLLGALAVGALMTRVHLLWPRIFPEPASFPWLDALTTVMSFVAMWLLARKKVEAWIYWIIVDLIGIGLYHAKEVQLLALLYVVLLGIAGYGWWHWHVGRARLPRAAHEHATMAAAREPQRPAAATSRRS